MSNSRVTDPGEIILMLSVTLPGCKPVAQDALLHVQSTAESAWLLLAQ